MDQWTRPENPEREPHKYAQVNFDKGAKQFNKGTISLLFQQMILDHLNLDLNFTPNKKLTQNGLWT